MRFAYDLLHFPGILIAIGCALFVVAFAASLLLASLARVRAEKRFGDPSLVAKLATFDAAGRRAAKGVMLVLALALAFGALSRPQSAGQRVLPATNLDVVVVLDYSKSMYARDILPSRIARAKAEVSELIRKLKGARFGAVAFAGEPMNFPLTSDGAAIAQFFRQLEPNDMPVGGTAIAKALEKARDTLASDPKSKDHVRVIVLITDGEDLEGDPLNVAREAAKEGTRIDVVQIGGRAPEVIPEVVDGKVTGIRRDAAGKPLTTELSAEGEAQLAGIAKETNGNIVRSDKGETGIDTIAAGLSRMMKEELSEKIQIVGEEQYAWPLALALLLLILEALIPEAPRQKVAVLKGAPALATGSRKGANRARA
ncbi:VWA domain-containing protein [Pendulispora brunnea]|uniref:VWA domain-containing protein n=1 Tax=Pendulispora brunnea TaxID=2905690 RepID=A0ABZ2KG13_9BACT